MVMHHHAHNGSTHTHGHTHTHGAVDPSILTTERGILVTKWSFVGLFITALLQMVVVILSGSVALLSDTIHNFGDAMTAIPLGIAFTLARLKPSKRFTYGYGRVEDLAGVIIVAIILFSAVVAGYQSILRLVHQQSVHYLPAVAVAALIGFIGNEIVAVYRIKVGNDIGSAALVADGYHARVDGITSLAVLAGAFGVWLGFPLADPIIGLIIAAAIFRIVWDSSKTVFTRLLDGVEPDVIDEIRHAVHHTQSVRDITEVRVRWIGHRLNAELNIAVDPVLSVEQGHGIAKEVRHQLMHHLKYLSNVTIHIDPATASGEEHHRIVEHKHDDLPAHSH